MLVARHASIAHIVHNAYNSMCAFSHPLPCSTTAHNCYTDEETCLRMQRLTFTPLCSPFRSSGSQDVSDIYFRLPSVICDGGWPVPRRWCRLALRKHLNWAHAEGLVLRSPIRFPLLRCHCMNARSGCARSAVPGRRRKPTSGKA